MDNSQNLNDLAAAAIAAARDRLLKPMCDELKNHQKDVAQQSNREMLSAFANALKNVSWEDRK